MHLSIHMYTLEYIYDLDCTKCSKLIKYITLN